tara:strand:+ start:1029 stop:1301 length:273 start_codon:yes stop_codon:yes gene_type:complete
MSNESKEHLKEVMWINWSEIGREEILKKLIFENYMKTKKISDKEWEFCEKIDWHPVDELPLKKEFIEKLKRIKKEKSRKVKFVSDIFKNV